MKRLFRLDKVTHMASVELWVLMTTLLLVVRFILDFMAPSYAHRSRAATVIIHILNHAMVQYTMGMMQLSAARVNDYFQVWAVLLVTLQYSVKTGNPYGRSKQIPLLDLMSTFWAANLLRMQTFILLKVPLWLIWALNATRIISYFSLSERAATINQETTRLVSDYMRYEHTLGHSDDAAHPGKEFKMRWYKYLVLGEDLVLNKVQRQLKRTASPQQQGQTASARYRIQLKENHKELITVEKIWNVGAGSSGLLGDTADAGNRLKDVCLSFALYKLLRRRFYDLPIHEASQEKTKKLVFDYILQEDNNYERAFRVTEVELSVLRDFFYSKHATMFASGFPVLSMLLSASLVAATGYIAYPVRHIPERMDQDDRNRITHGVFVTRLIIALIITKELSEIFLYVFSQWAKVQVICMYVKHHFLRHRLVEAAIRLMFWFIVRGKWDQRIFQYNLLISSACSKPTWLHISSCIILRNKSPTRFKLEPEVTKAIFESFKGLQQHPERLESYFSNAFGSKADLMQQLTWAIELEADTHRILVWHIATCLCEIKLSNEAAKLKVVRLQTRMLVNKSRAPEAVWAHYLTAASLSNYCAYLLTKALVPDNGLVVNNVFDVVRQETLSATSCSRSQSMQDVYDKLMENFQKPGKESGKATTGQFNQVHSGLEHAAISTIDEQVPKWGSPKWKWPFDWEEPNGSVWEFAVPCSMNIGEEELEIHDGIDNSITNEQVLEGEDTIDEEEPEGEDTIFFCEIDEEEPEEEDTIDEEELEGEDTIHEEEPEGEYAIDEEEPEEEDTIDEEELEGEDTIHEEEPEGEYTIDEEEPEEEDTIDEEELEGEDTIHEEEPEGEDTIDGEELKEDDDINSIIQMGAKLGKQLIEAYGEDRVGLWRDLAEFWTGFLLHLAASTRAAKHKTQLVGNRELITHLWALLTHAGFLGRTIHGQTLLDPEDLEDVDPLS